MCTTTTAPTQLPTLTKWSAHRIGGVPMRYTYAIAQFGQFQIQPVLCAASVNVVGWKLLVSLTLPYGATGQLYQLDQVAGVNKAAALVKQAGAFFADKAARQRVMQAVLDAATVQHI